MDLEIRVFNETLVSFINQAKLPLEVKRLVVNDIARQINLVADNNIKAQREAAEAQAEEASSENS